MAVKRYTNKELQSKTPEELEQIINDCVKEHHRLGEQIRGVLEKGTSDMKEIVKIVIKGGSGYGPADEAYNDKVTIEKKGISYEYSPTFESETNPVRKWSYKTNSSVYGMLYENLKKSIVSVTERCAEMFCTDIGSIEFIITFDDKTKFKKTFFLPGDEFKEVFSIIKQMVPGCEYVPAVLITEEDYANCDEL